MNKDFPLFVTKMLEVLVTTSNPERTRHMAGTLFKRAISSLVIHYACSSPRLEWRDLSGEAGILETDGR